MYNVRFTTGATRHPERQVSGETVVKDFLAEFGGYVGTLMWNGVSLSKEDDTKTFAELAAAGNTAVADGGDIMLFDAPKTANA